MQNQNEETNGCSIGGIEAGKQLFLMGQVKQKLQQHRRPLNYLLYTRYKEQKTTLLVGLAYRGGKKPKQTEKKTLYYLSQGKPMTCREKL